MKLERAYYDSCRLASSGKPSKLPSGLTPHRHQKISDQESQFLPIPGSIQERDSIIGQENYLFQPEAERVRPYDPEIFGPCERSTKNKKTVVNTFDEARSPRIKGNIYAQSEHNFMTPEITIHSVGTPLHVG
ncbi:hypothetical protein O181_106626 [Austropuccinia psidii MF-1]|uniref:Uncharacterized protein n=1 Tax=Austropuccinia psidii MF-1 TaxID=1389203 RepID=A0A9Q3JRC1_9BASI|nr:hypothetical protein [Austropuccinia psidii MF-1]